MVPPGGQRALLELMISHQPSLQDRLWIPVTVGFRNIWHCSLSSQKRTFCDNTSTGRLSQAWNIEKQASQAQNEAL